MKLKIRVFYYLFALLLIHNGKGLIAHTHIESGIIAGTWFAKKSPYYIDGDIIVTEGTLVLLR